ncbi:site-specific integrase [Pseudomonas asiatica]|uniref:tyrosine-type recombinase/integrase n=1 Tax=Pseudomonas asiatica TaxID=2219225 RepID=UPI001F310ABB|nr:site-specific integrase [Pseudomonas asiatica]MCO8260037.1 site-specific integrase [Pseudomonas asiatica]
MAKPIAPKGLERAVLPENVFFAQRALKQFFLNFSGDSRATMSNCLKYLARDIGYDDSRLERVPWQRLDAPTIISLVSEWQNKYSTATIELRLIAARKIIRCCTIQGLIPDNQYREVGALRFEFEQWRDYRGVYVNSDTIVHLMRSCLSDDRYVLALRDCAMVALLFGAGLRRAEASAVRRDDVNLKNTSLQIFNKGKPTSRRLLLNWAHEPLINWLEESGNHIDCGDCILQRVSKSGRVLGNLTAEGLYSALRSRCLEAGICPLGPHDARRTFAMDFSHKYGLSAAKIALGHKSITSTLKYDQSGDQAYEWADF